MLKYEFAQPGSSGDEIIVKEENLHWILNVDETKMSLDGSKTNAGGRPAITFHDPHLPMPHISVAKSLPHWQILTTATAVECEKVRVNFLRHFMNSQRRFGCEEVREWLATIGMNKKGGMNDEEFDKYVNNMIVPLFPDLEDVPGKRMLLKVDSSPGQNKTALLLKGYFLKGLPLFRPPKYGVRSTGNRH
jgi:hypothetical protein